MKYSTFWQVTPRVKLTVSWNLTVLINFKVWVSSLQMSGWWTRRDKYHSKWSTLLTNGKKTAILTCTLSDKLLTPRSSYTRHWLDHYTEHLNLSESRFEPHWQITGSACMPKYMCLFPVINFFTAKFNIFPCIGFDFFSLTFRRKKVKLLSSASASGSVTF